MSIHDIPTFPYRLVEHDAAGIANIEDAPMVAAERAFFLLFTSDEFQNSPVNFGSLTPEGRTLLPCLHALVSIAISHADNVYTRTPAYADRDASNIIFRTFEHPTQRGNFAILMQVNIGADPNPTDRHRDTNLHFCAPLQKNADAGDIDAAADDDAGGGDEGGRGRARGRARGRGRGRGGRGADAPIVNDFAHEVDAVFEDGAAGMAGAPFDDASAKRRRTGGSGGRVSLALRIYDVGAYARCLFSAYDLGRMDATVNGRRIVCRPQPVAEERDFRTLHSLPLRSNVNEAAYIDAFLSRVAIFGAALSLDPRIVSMKGRLSDDKYAAMQQLEDPRFQLKQPYGLMRVATSLPNALARLRAWGQLHCIAGANMHQWLEPSSYIGVAGVAFASPRGVPTFTMDIDRATMTGFLTLPLPLPMTCEELLRTGDMQIALWNCTKDHVVFEVVRAMNTYRPGLMRAHMMRGLIANLEARFGAGFVDGLGSRVEEQAPLSRTALFNILVAVVMPSRSLHQNVFHLNDYTTKWRRTLLTPASKSWELLALRQMALRAFRDMHAAGVDEDVVSRLVVDALDSGQGINMAKELANFRSVFAMAHWGDLDHGAEHIAKFCMHLQTVTGARETWLELFIVMLASSASASLRFGKIHICLLGPAACGKSMIIEWAMRLAWPMLTRSAVYESSAASRATDPTRESRQAQLAEESAGVGYYTTPEQRAVRISALSETVTRHRTVAINKDAPDPRKQRVLVESNVWDCSSQIIATNVPPNREDNAAASRYAIRTMCTQPYSSQTYVEAQSASRELAAVAGASHENILRAIRFFTLMMASVFTLDTIGATELPEYSVNIAILNAIMSDTTDASQVRRSKRLDRMTHVLGAWCGMFKFLLSPFSPLTLIYDDALSLEALMRMPDFMSVSCAPGIFVASLSPLMHDDMFLRTIINILCTVVFRPRNSMITQALAAYMVELRQLRANPSYTDVATQERAERMLLLRHICALFPLGPHNALTNHRECVVFSIKTLEQYTANSGPGGGSSSSTDVEQQTAGFSGARMMRHSSRGDVAVGGLDSAGNLRLRSEDSMDGMAAAAAAAAGPGPSSQQDQHPPFLHQQPQPQAHLHSYYPPVYEMLTGSAIGSAMESLAEAIFPLLSASVYSGVKIVKKATAALNTVKTEIIEVLNRLKIKCLVNGMYTTHWRNLMIEDEGAALQKIQMFTRDYDVPGGSYVVAQVVHPSPRAEALNVVRVADDGRRKALDALMNLHGGRPAPYIALLASNVDLSLEDRARILQSLDPNLRTQDPSSWFRLHTDVMRRTGLALVRSPSCYQVLRIYNSQSTDSDETSMMRLFCRPAYHTDIVKRNKSAERLIGCIEDRGIGVWRRGMLLPRELCPDVPGHEARNLPSYHDYLKYHATDVNQSLLPASRRAAAQRAGPSVSQPPPAAAAAAEPLSVRVPFDFSSAVGTQPTAAADEDASAVNDMMELQLEALPALELQDPAAAAADDDDDEEVPATARDDSELL